MHSQLKIEGRTKSRFYVARTAQVYRKAIDDAVAGKPFDKSLMDTLNPSPIGVTPKAFYAAMCMIDIRIINTVLAVGSASNLLGNLRRA